MFEEFYINISASRDVRASTDSKSFRRTSSMDIYLAKFALEILDLKHINKTLYSKLDNETTYCVELIEILTQYNIPFNLENLVETKWRILNQDFSEKKCKGCNSPVNFVSLYKGFRQFCSKSCASLHRDPNTIKGWTTKEGYQLSRNTLYKKYGAYHQQHVPHLFENQQSKRYKTYTVVSPSQINYKVQGYERYIIPFLWKNYKERDIVVSKKDLPKIFYKDGTKLKKYYPDSYIISSNTLVEVKSTFTIKEKNLIKKMKSSIENGYNINVYLYDKSKISILDIEDIKNYLEKP
jgi:hypothetical protein